MARKSKFTRFTNPSGENVFRVTGTLNSKRFRRNFKTRNAAVAERDALEVERINGINEGRFLFVKMTTEQNDDAWTALQLLQKAKIKRSLTDAAQYYIQHYWAPEVDLTLKESVRGYIATREKEYFVNTSPFVFMSRAIVS